jgi:flagellar motility protein MotE (MotC chaperone)
VKDMQTHLEKLRTQAAECELIRDLATDKVKREMFAKLAEHFRVLGDELEGEIKKRTSFTETFLDSKTQEPFPKED